MTPAVEAEGDRLVEVDPTRWDAVLRGADVTDVYYSRGFVAASALLVRDIDM